MSDIAQFPVAVRNTLASTDDPVEIGAAVTLDSDLTVNGPATLASLTVDGAATFDGTVSGAGLTPGNNGSISTATGTVSCPSNTKTSVLTASVASPSAMGKAFILVMWSVSWTNGSTAPGSVTLSFDFSSGPAEVALGLHPGQASTNQTASGSFVVGIGADTPADTTYTITMSLTPTSQAVTAVQLGTFMSAALVPSQT